MEAVYCLPLPIEPIMDAIKPLIRRTRMTSRNAAFIACLLIASYATFAGQIIDHTAAHSHDDLHKIPPAAIEHAKATLHVAYGHTSHGSQLISGMSNLDTFMQRRYNTPRGLYAYNDGPAAGKLDIDDNFAPGDLGNPNRLAWAQRTRDYLQDPANKDVNVVMWSWCGQVDGSESEIGRYLSLMSQLEDEFPKVVFVYMTGHLNGGGEKGNVNLRNQQIRDFCKANNKWLYDFADIESWDPDARKNYMPLKANDNADYDSDGDGRRDRNWAKDWQGSHQRDYDWYPCPAAHSQPLVANLKAYAAWDMFTRIASQIAGKSGR